MSPLSRCRLPLLVVCALFAASCGNRGWAIELQVTADECVQEDIARLVLEFAYGGMPAPNATWDSAEARGGGDFVTTLQRDGEASLLVLVRDDESLVGVTATAFDGTAQELATMPLEIMQSTLPATPTAAELLLSRPDCGNVTDAGPGPPDWSCVANPALADCLGFDDTTWPPPRTTWEVLPPSGSCTCSPVVTLPGEVLWGYAFHLNVDPCNPSKLSCFLQYDIRAPRSPQSTPLYLRAFVRTDISQLDDYVEVLGLWTDSSESLLLQLDQSGYLTVSLPDTMQTLPVTGVDAITPGEWTCIELGLQSTSVVYVEVSGQSWTGNLTTAFPSEPVTLFTLGLGYTEAWWSANWTLEMDEVAFDTSPIPCPDPATF